jgi:hypothetical protein
VKGAMLSGQIKQFILDLWLRDEVGDQGPDSNLQSFWDKTKTKSQHCLLFIITI